LTVGEIHRLFILIGDTSYLLNLLDKGDPSKADTDHTKAPRIKANFLATA